MKYKDLFIGKKCAVLSDCYFISQILTFGRGPLFGCRKFIFTPENKNLPELFGIQWQDGEIDRLKKKIVK